MRILVFGDSITWGGYDTEGGWADRIKRQMITDFVGEGEKHQLYNMGIGGETSTGLLARIEAETTARQSSSWQFAFVIATGINDTRDVDQPGNIETTPELFAENLHGIIQIAKKYSSKILVLGLTLAQSETLQFKNLTYKNDVIRAYDQIITDVTTAEGVPKVALLHALEDGAAKGLYVSDGLHPNDAGHELIASLVQPELAKLFI
jgi:lysophospholipase L1-like esterase